MPRGRSASPSRMRGRSNSPSRMMQRGGRSKSPSRMQSSTATRSSSVDPSRMRGRSKSPSTMRGRGRSSSPSRMKQRGRSNSPSRTRGRSNSPSQRRGRSNSPSRMRGRSKSPGGTSRDSRSASRERRGKMGRFRDSFRRTVRKGGKRGTKRPEGKARIPEGQSGGRGKLHKGRKVIAGAPRALAKAPKQLGRGIKRAPKVIAKAPKQLGRGIKRAPKAIAKAPKQLGRGIKRGGRHIKQRIAPEQDCPLWKICAYVLPVVIIIGCSIGLISATDSAEKFTPTFVSNLIPKLDGKDVVDPNAGRDSTSITKWDNGGSGGLSIEILNAMSGDWAKFFDVVISDYEYGNPDALTLTIQKVQEEKECKAVQGKIKTCNGDYGETKWRGINTQSFDTGGYVVASTARMNEYYLEFDVEDAKQYTICHELGHAFGLAHTDEDFGNEDLGNCLDYSNNYVANKHPDASNYEVLAALYGSVSGRRGLLRGTSSIATNNNDNDNRELSESLWMKMHEAVEKLAARLDDNAHEDGWKLLHRTTYGEAHELELEEGYKIRVHMLLASN